MDFLIAISKTREHFKSKQPFFSKQDLKFNTGKDSFRGKMFGFLTSGYYKREKLFKSGDVFYALTIKSWNNNFVNDRPLATWLIFSPSSEFDANPEYFYTIKAKIDEFIQNKDAKKINRKLYYSLTENLSEPMFFELPSFLSDGKLVYLSIAYAKKNQIPHFHLGINMIIMNHLVSKEVQYLPQIYWSEDFDNYYEGRSQ